MHVVLLLYPGLTQLDLTGPYEVFASLEGVTLHLAWKEPGPVRADSGMEIVATTSFDACPQADVLFVPGGLGQARWMGDAEVLSFLARQGELARFVTSACGGSLLLGAAGLLRGRRAACHWMFVDALATFGAVPCKERVVVDGNRMTGGGVTAGIDVALRLVGTVADEETARGVELALEYAPEPPFGTGRPDLASEALVTTVRARLQAKMASLS